MGLTPASTHHVDQLKELCCAGHLGKALQTVRILYQRGSSIASNVLCCFLRCCNEKRHLETGRALYELISQHHNMSDAYLGTQFIRMFAACGSLVEANHVFEHVLNPDAYTWTAIISAHVKFRHNKEALALYNRMLQSSVEPDGHLFVAALKACSNPDDLYSARLIHRRMVQSCLKPDVVVNNTLIDVYTKCQSLREAREMFDIMPFRNVVTWNTMIAGYSQHECSKEAFELLSRMSWANVAPNSITFASILKACSGTTSLQEGRLLHSYIMESGCNSDDFLGSSLTDAYSKWGSVEDARKVFDCISSRCIVTWTSMIAGYAQHEYGEQAIQLFQKMCQEGIEPNILTFSSLVKACADAADLDCVLLVHIGIIRAGFESDMVIGSALVDVYAKQGSIEDAAKVFNGLGEKNVVTWSSMIAGYAHSLGYELKALQLFEQMLALGIAAYTPTYVSVLRACTGLEAFEYGRLVHFCILDGGFDCHEFVVSSTIDMYAKCHSIEDAYSMFQKLRFRDNVIFNAMISGFSLQGRDEDAIQLFYEMMNRGPAPDTVTLVGILKSCSKLAALLDGKLIYSYILETQLEGNLHVGNSLIDMFATCYCMEDGKCVFNGLQKRDHISWTAMVTGYAHEKNYKLALKYYHDMQNEGWKPDNVTMVSILSACSQESLVVEGCDHFEAMENQKITPSKDHFNCMVDLLGNSGHLEEAVDLLLCTPRGFDTVGWTSLLGHCSEHHNVEVGRHCFDHVVTLDDKKTVAYLLMHKLRELATMYRETSILEPLQQPWNA